MKRFITSVILVTLVGIVGTPAIVLGQEDPDMLLAISDDETLTDEERFTKAKDGLVLALNLAIEKVAKLRTSLDEQEYDDGSLENELKADFVVSLDGYGVYYSETVVSAETLTTLQEVKGLAQEVRAYRDEIYTPGIEEIVQFILVFYTDNIIGVANDRFEKISKDINTLESLGLIKEDRFLEKMTQIETLLTEARELNVQAKDMIIIPPDKNVEEATTTISVLETDIPDDDVSTTTVQESITDEGEGETVPAMTEEEGEDVESIDPLEASLNNVKLVYEIFLEISKDVKTTLGLE